MEQSRLIKYIQELAPKERERFREFVLSPYFNQHKKTTELLELILDQLDKKSGKGLEKEVVYKKLFPKEAFDEQKLHNVMSYLKKLYHRFLSQQYMESLDFQEELFTLEYAYINNRFDLLTNRSKQLEKKLISQPYHDASYFFANYRLNYLLGYYSGNYADRSKSELFQKMLNNLDQYYIVEKLRNCCHLTANMMMMNTHYEFRFIEELLEHVQINEDNCREDHSILLYYSILMSMREENNTEHYEQLKTILDLHIHQLNLQESSDLYAFAINYCIRKINAGESNYQRELFGLYKSGLKTGLLLSNGLLSEWNYKNITALGCSLKEFEWTENFILEYKDKLLSNRRDNAYNYNLAHLYYNKKMYSEALSALLLVQFSDMMYHLSTTFLMLRTYYALRDTEALLSLIETFRIYVIRNQKMTVDQKRGYTNFLRFAKKLVLLKHHASTYSRKALEEKLLALKEKIDSTENVINRYWLVEECAA